MTKQMREQYANQLEVLEVAFLEEGFSKMNNRSEALTTDMGWDCTLEVYNEGWYMKFTGTQSSFNCFTVWGGEVIRKPRNIKMTEKYVASGNGTTVQGIRKTI